MLIPHPHTEVGHSSHVSRDDDLAIVGRGRSGATSRCGGGGSRGGSDTEEMQVREVEVKVGGSGTFGWPSRGGGRRMG